MTWILCFVRFNPALKRRYPDLAALRQEGLMSDGEMTKLEHHYILNEDPELWMVPLTWSANLVRRYLIIYQILTIILNFVTL